MEVEQTSKNLKFNEGNFFSSSSSSSSAHNNILWSGCSPMPLYDVVDKLEQAFITPALRHTHKSVKDSYRLIIAINTITSNPLDPSHVSKASSSSYAL
jgi:hypothetical protein